MNELAKEALEELRGIRKNRVAQIDKYCELISIEQRRLEETDEMINKLEEINE